MFTQRLFGFGDADGSELELLLGVGAVESVFKAVRPSLRVSPKHPRQRGPTPPAGALQSELLARLLPVLGGAAPEQSPSPLRVQSGARRRRLVDVDGADRVDVCAEGRVGVTAVSQQPVGGHCPGRGGSEVSGLRVISIHRYVQQGREGPGGLGLPAGPLGTSQAELLQLLQQAELLLHLLSSVELKAPPEICRRKLH